MAHRSQAKTGCAAAAAKPAANKTFIEITFQKTERKTAYTDSRLGKIKLTAHAMHGRSNDRSGENEPWRRSRRRVSKTAIQIRIFRHFPESRRRAENKSHRHIRKLELFQIERGIRFLFRALAFRDVLAKFAGMFAVESFHNGLGEGSI